MHDTLPLVAETEVRESMSLDIALQRHALKSGVLLFDELFDIFEVGPRRRGYIVIGCLASSRNQHPSISAYAEFFRPNLEDVRIAIKVRSAIFSRLREVAEGYNLSPRGYNLGGGRLDQHYGVLQRLGA